MEKGRRTARGEREIGHAGGYSPGPTVICVAALHGNEPAGVRALDQVFQKILDHRLTLRGEFAGLIGNVTALDRKERLINEDMNRMWSPSRLASSGSVPEADETSESREQRKLYPELERLLLHASGPVILLDYHTASSTTAPFVILGDTLRNREFGRRFPLPIVLGLEEYIQGTLMEHISELGHIGVAVEGGRHDDVASVERLESVTWLALVHAACLKAADVPEFDLHQERLRRAGEGIPPVLEIFYREPAGPEFHMARHFENFQHVKRGEELAREPDRTITARKSARVFLPRYQPVGDDGFFLARHVNPLWLAVSTRMRQSRLPGWASRLPGVQRHPEKKNTLLVDRRIARFFARKVFHLLGYRVMEIDSGKMIVERRPDESADPDERG